MKYIFYFILIFGILWAEQKAYIQSASQIVGSNQSVNEVRPIALLEAKRLALEQAGTYVESITVSEDFEITKDEVLSLTAGVVSTKILDEKVEVLSGAIKFTITIEALIELADLEARIRELKEQGADNTTLEENKALRDEKEELERQLRELKAQLEQARSKEEAEQIQQRANDGILKEAKASEEVDKARDLIQKGRRDPSKLAEAEEVLEKAAVLDPNQAFCDYYLQKIAEKRNRSLGAQMQILKRALSKNPNFAVARFELGKVYFEIYKRNRKQQFYLDAVKELQAFIRAQPKNPKGYIMLSVVHNKTAQTHLERQVLQDCLRMVPDTKSNRRDLIVVKQKLGLKITPRNTNNKPPRNTNNKPPRNTNNKPPRNTNNKPPRNTNNKPPRNTGEFPPHNTGNNQPANVRLVDPVAINTAKISIQHRNYPQALQILNSAIQPLKTNLQRNPNNPQACRDLARLYSTQGIVYRFMANLNGGVSAYNAATIYWKRMGIPQPQDKGLVAADYYQLAYLYTSLIQQNPRLKRSYHLKIVSALAGAIRNGYNAHTIQSHPFLRNYYAEAARQAAQNTTNTRNNNNNKPPVRVVPNNSHQSNVRLVDPAVINTAKISIQNRNYQQALQILNSAIQKLEAGLRGNPNNPQAFRDLARLYNTQAITYGFMGNLNRVTSAYQRSTKYWSKISSPNMQDKPRIADNYYQLAHTYSKVLERNPALRANYHRHIVNALKGALKYGYDSRIIQSHPFLRSYYTEASR